MKVGGGEDNSIDHIKVGVNILYNVISYRQKSIIRISVRQERELVVHVAMFQAAGHGAGM